MEKTSVQQIIEKFEYIKENNCNSLQEMVFFDGVLAVIESGKYKEIEKKQIEDAFTFSRRNINRFNSAKIYYKQTFKNDLLQND